MFLSFLFEQYNYVLCCVKYKKKFESTSMGLAHFKILIFSDFSIMRVGLEKRLIKFCHPLFYDFGPKLSVLRKYDV